MSQDDEFMEDMMMRYVTFMLSGFTIQSREVLVSTIKGYLRAVNTFYKSKRLRLPYDTKMDTPANRLLKEQAKVEDAPERRAPLPDKVLVRMCELGKADPLGFRAAVSDITLLGRFGGFRQQEFAMDSKDTIKYYVKPDGSLVTRSFTVSNFLFRDEDEILIKYPLIKRASVCNLGTLYEMQKNRMNGQVLWYQREPRFPDYCPVCLGLNLVWRAGVLGQTGDDPLCVYRDEKGLRQPLIVTGWS